MNVNKFPIPRSPKTIENRLGFTLVELLVSVAVISILAGMAAQTFRSVLGARDIAINRLEMNETARSALGFMSAEIRAAYLTPDSVIAVVQGQQNTTGPRFRFAGIHRNLVVDRSADDNIPSALIDDDGDGDEDEEILDGLDNDGDELIDEDLGDVPSDILHFVSAVENSGDVILQEVSYGLDPTGTRLIRRGQTLSLNGGGNDVKEIGDFGLFIDNQSNERLLPPILPVGVSTNANAVKTVIENWDKGAKYGSLDARNVQSNNSPGKIFEPLAYDIRGLRLRYWYYDYNRGGWRWTSEWDSSRETALVLPDSALFNDFAANSSIEGSNRRGFQNIIVNEPDDMYPRQSTSNTFLVNSPQLLMNNPEYREVRDRVIKRTDGLPNMVEITLYVQDRKRTNPPQPYTTRVFIPNNYRSIGL